MTYTVELRFLAESAEEVFYNVVSVEPRLGNTIEIVFENGDKMFVPNTYIITTKKEENYEQQES